MQREGSPRVTELLSGPTHRGVAGTLQQGNRRMNSTCCLTNQPFQRFLLLHQHHLSGKRISVDFEPVEVEATRVCTGIESDGMVTRAALLIQ